VQAFSSVVASAKELGYTEPDPREDLSGGARAVAGGLGEGEAGGLGVGGGFACVGGWQLGLVEGGRSFAFWTHGRMQSSGVCAEPQGVGGPWGAPRGRESKPSGPTPQLRRADRARPPPQTGMDVARKVVILARGCGLKTELSQLTVGGARSVARCGGPRLGRHSRSCGRAAPSHSACYCSSSSSSSLPLALNWPGRPTPPAPLPLPPKGGQPRAGPAEGGQPRGVHAAAARGGAPARGSREGPWLWVLRRFVGHPPPPFRLRAGSQLLWAAQQLTLRVEQPRTEGSAGRAWCHGRPPHPHSRAAAPVNPPHQQRHHQRRRRRSLTTRWGRAPRPPRRGAACCDTWASSTPPRAPPASRCRRGPGV
jgi:hypothetical protein